MKLTTIALLLATVRIALAGSAAAQPWQPTEYPISYWAVLGPCESA